jgi:GxxExxY protein
MVVANKIYIELKAQKLSGIETAQVLSGLKASGLLIGLLINFNELHLRDGIRRIIKTDSVV